MTGHRLARNPDPMPWADRASCVGMDPDLFYPPLGRCAAAYVAEAKAVCADCPVRADCLDHALRHHEDHGVWGGRTEQERRRIRRQRARRGAA